MMAVMYPAASLISDYIDLITKILLYLITYGIHFLHIYNFLLKGNKSYYSDRKDYVSSLLFNDPLTISFSSN